MELARGQKVIEKVKEFINNEKIKEVQKKAKAV